MKSFIVRASQIAVAVVAVGVMSMKAPAQTATFNGTASEQWSTSANWSPAGVLSGTGAHALINSQTSALLRLLYTSGSFSTQPAVQMGAITFLSTLANTSGTVTGTFNVQNNSAGTKGTLRLYGVDTTVDGLSRRFIIVNSSTMANVQFTQSNAGQDFELFTNGAVHVTAGTQLTLTSLIRNGGTTAQSITKTGNGILSLSGTANSSANNNADLSTYSGGFTLDGGIVQWASSGTANVSTPFGIGSLTLKNGTLRSTNTTGKSINTNVILDGSATFGSTVTGFTGNITVNSQSGTLATTVASDSVVTIVAGGSTAWNQSTSGAGSITKAGTGLLRFTPLSTLTHTGSTVVQEGTLIMSGSLTSASAVTVLSGALLTGTGGIAGATTILAGGTFSPGATSGAVGLFTFGSGGLTLAGQTLLEFSGTGTARGIDFDAVNLGGNIAYGGGLSLALTGTTYGDNTALKLFDFAGGASGSFSSVTASGLYGPLTFTNEGSGVWTSGATNVPGQTLTFTEATGVLSVVPEPSAVALGGLGVAAAAFVQWRRAGHRRRARRAGAAG